MVFRSTLVVLSCLALVLSGCLQMTSSPNDGLRDLDRFAQDQDEASRPVMVAGVNMWGFEQFLTEEDKEMMQAALSDVSEQERRIVTALLGGTPLDEGLYSLHGLLSMDSQGLRVDMLDEDGAFNVAEAFEQEDPDQLPYDLRDWEQDGANFARIYDNARIVAGWPGETSAGFSSYVVMPTYAADGIGDDAEEVGFVAIVLRAEYDGETDCIAGAIVVLDAMSTEIMGNEPIEDCKILETFRAIEGELSGALTWVSRQYSMSNNPLAANEMVIADLSDAAEGSEIIFQSMESILLPVELSTEIEIRSPSGQRYSLGATDLLTLDAEPGQYELRLVSTDVEDVTIFVDYMRWNEDPAMEGSTNTFGLPLNPFDYADWI